MLQTEILFGNIKTVHQSMILKPISLVNPDDISIFNSTADRRFKFQYPH